MVGEPNLADGATGSQDSSDVALPTGANQQQVGAGAAQPSTEPGQQHKPSAPSTQQTDAAFDEIY
jgi:hypothetical protein